MLRTKLCQLLPQTSTARAAGTFAPSQSMLLAARFRAHPTISRPPLLTRSVQSQRRTFFTSSPRQVQYVKFGGGQDQPFLTQVKARYGLVLVLVGVGGVWYVTHLEQVPETGRWRYMDINPKYETQLGEMAHRELCQEFSGKILPPNHPLTRHITRVVSKLLEASDLGSLRHINPRDGTGRTEEVAPGVGGREWTLMVVHDDHMVNAMTSYGNVVVFTGILPVAKDEAGLAAVLSHEIGHTVARHNSETYSFSKFLMLGLVALSYMGVDLSFSQLLSEWLLRRPHGRTQEYEADKIGLTILAKACYDPNAAVDMFTRLGKMENRQSDFLSTHPTSEKRVRELKLLLPEAYNARAASAACVETQDSYKVFSNLFGSGFGGYS